MTGIGQSPADARRALASAHFGVRQANASLRAIAHASGGDPYGLRTVTGAKTAYVRGEIEVDELENRLDILLGRIVP